MTDERHRIASSAQQRLLLGLLLVSMAFIQSPVEQSAGLPFSYPLYGMLFVLLVVLWLARRPWARPIGGFEIGLLALGAWMALASIRSEPRSLQHLLMWQSGIVLAIYAAHQVGRAFDHDFVRRILAGIALMQVMVCLMQLAVYENGQPIVAPEVFSSLFGDQAVYGGGSQPIDVSWRFMTGAPGLGRRLTVAPGTFWTVNVLGAWTAITLPVLVAGGQAAWARGRRASGGFYLALAAGSFLLVVRNLTRVTIAAAVLGLCTYGVLRMLTRPGHGRARRWLRLLPWLLIPLGLFAAVDAKNRGLVSAVVHGRVLERSSEDAILRFRLIRAGIAAIGQHPFLGWGHGNYNRAMPPVAELALGISEQKDRAFGSKPRGRLSAHNAYLILVHDGGLPALGFFLLSVAVAAKAFWARRDRWRSEELALAASLAAALFTCLFYASMYRWLWPFFLFILGCLRGETEKEASGE